MTASPLITIIVPIYKVEKYLKKCVNSILVQTYVHLEIILVDDGSPDHCPEMCDAFAKQDSRIKVIHKKNGGLSDARNAALNIASGDFIGFIDSDDWCEPDMFEQMLRMQQKNNVSIVICGVSKDKEDSKESEIIAFRSDEVVLEQKELLSRFFAGRDIPAWVWNKLYKKELWEKMRFPIQQFEDMPVISRFFMKIDKVGYIGSPLYHYLYRNSSISSSIINNNFSALLDSARKNIDFSKKLFHGEFNSETKSNYTSITFHFIRKILVTKNKDLYSWIPGLKTNLKTYRSFIFKSQTLKLFDKFFAFGISFGLSPFFVIGFRTFLKKISGKK